MLCTLRARANQICTFQISHVRTYTEGRHTNSLRFKAIDKPEQAKDNIGLAVEAIEAALVEELDSGSEYL